jgi:hypothetical protein
MGLPPDTVRSAGTNHVLVGVTYDGKARVVEPHTLRRPRTGNLLLCAGM